MGTETMKRKFSTRISKLGTETAYAVSAEAHAAAKSGIKVYPFHIGDLNIPTPEIFKKGKILLFLNETDSGKFCHSFSQFFLDSVFSTSFFVQIIFERV